MLLTASSADDFHRHIAPAYDELIYTTEAPTTLEVALAPGEYRDGSLSLVDIEERGHVGLILRAADPLRPPVLTNLRVRLTACDVRLEGIIFKQSQSGTPLLTASVNDSLRLDRCAFIGNVRDVYPPGEPLIELNARFDAQRDKTALFCDCWFIGNKAYTPSTMLAFGGLPSFRFGRITFENTAFLDNRFSVCIAPNIADELRLSDCFVFTSVPQPDEEPRQFIIVSYLQTAVTLERSTAICGDFDGLLTFSSTPPQPCSAYAAAAVRDTQLYLEEPLPSGKLSKPVTFDKVQVCCAVLPNPANLAAALENFVALAERGGALDLSQRVREAWAFQLTD